MASAEVITVFGGTGFLGRRIVRDLRSRGLVVRVAARHVQRMEGMLDAGDESLQLISMNVHDESAVRAAVDGAHGVVNAVSLYLEQGNASFHSVHVAAASRIARLASDVGVRRLVHVSGVGADPSSPSLYIRERGEGEHAVRASFPDVCLVRPTVMFGHDDRFLTPLRSLVSSFPVFPLFGRGITRLQPVHVSDVAEGIARLISENSPHPATFELGGPGIYSYRQIIRALARSAGADPVLLPVPLEFSNALALLGERLPGIPISRNQVDLMRLDNVTSANMPGFSELEIEPRSLEETLPELAHIGAA
jgi:uncharacterized protein YbjT (DUF2867 family)